METGVVFMAKKNTPRKSKEISLPIIPRPTFLGLEQEIHLQLLHCETRRDSAEVGGYLLMKAMRILGSVTPREVLLAAMEGHLSDMPDNFVPDADVQFTGASP